MRSVNTGEMRENEAPLDVFMSGSAAFEADGNDSVSIPSLIMKRYRYG